MLCYFYLFLFLLVLRFVTLSCELTMTLFEVSGSYFGHLIWQGFSVGILVVG